MRILRHPVVPRPAAVAHLERLDLAHDVVDGARPLRTPERGDGAESARPIAALGDLHVRPGGARARTGQVQQIERRERLGASGSEGDRHPEPGDAIDLGERLCVLIAIPLGHAAGHDETRPFGPPGLEPEHRLDGLGACLFDERARVDDHDIGVLGSVGRHQTIGQHRADELVRIDLVLGAAEGLDPEAFSQVRPVPRAS